MLIGVNNEPYYSTSPEGAMAWISGHFGPDFSKYDPDEVVQNIEIPGIQGLFDSIIYAKGGAPEPFARRPLSMRKGWGCRAW
jgi:long-chain alkane monooxygenase